MTEIEVQVVAGGFYVEQDGLTYELDGVERDTRRGVRGNLRLRQGDTVVHRTRLSLTADGSRRSFVAKCQEKDVEASEAVILALEDAAGRDRRQAADSAQKTGGGTGGDFSVTVPRITLSELVTEFKKWLLIKDDALLQAPVATVLAHLLGLDPVWLLLVAPPSGAKTEVLRALYGYPQVYALSALTSRTFASGLDMHGAGTPSLLEHAVAARCSSCPRAYSC
jgi:hypothetical protein